MNVFIFFSDLVKLYNSNVMDPDLGPRELQRKVMFDIRYYFCRCGGENIYDMNVRTFELQYDTTGISYVKKVIDEMTKNHREKDNELITGFMPQMRNPDGTVAKLCPVRSFENYINALDKRVDFLWQRPKFKFPKNKEYPWYIIKQVGHNTHEKFMGDLCKKANLSKHYTNHCIRVSGVTNLTRANFTSKQVMSVSGHKSIESLSLYQRVNEDEKMMMGFCLTYSLLNPYNARKAIQTAPDQQNMKTLPSTLCHQTPQKLPISPEEFKQAAPIENAVVPYNPALQQNPTVPQPSNPQFDLMELLSETIDEVNDKDLVMAATECEQAMVPVTKITTTTTSNTSVMKRINPQTTFTNCSFGSIGTLNIHIHKN